MGQERSETVNKIKQKEVVMSLKNIKVGDKVHIEPMTGFGDPSVEKVTAIKTRYKEETGKPYKVICVGDRIFHGTTGNAMNPPTRYYISGKAKKIAPRRDLAKETVKRVNKSLKTGEAKASRGGIIVKSRTVSQSKLSAECWPVQVWGLSACKTCEFRNKPDCGGKKIRKTGKNSLGFKVPI